MRANIVGAEWESCYLNDGDCEARRQQVLQDLEKDLNKAIALTEGEIIVIDVADHSIAVETFEVMAIFKRSGIVKLEYRGGAS